MQKKQKQKKPYVRHTEQEVRDAIAKTARHFVDAGMDPIKAEILALKLAVEHERNIRK